MAIAIYFITHQQLKAATPTMLQSVPAVLLTHPELPSLWHTYLWHTLGILCAVETLAPDTGPIPTLGMCRYQGSTQEGNGRALLQPRLSRKKGKTVLQEKHA